MAGWEQYDVHGVERVSWLGSVLCRSCIRASRSGRLGCRCTLDRDTARRVKGIDNPRLEHIVAYSIGGM